MAQPIKNVVLIGASGNLGRPILAALLSSSAFSVTVLSRESSEASFPSSVKVLKTDYTPSSLVSAFSGQDAVISVVGMGGFAEQKAMIDAAVQARVKRFIPSEFSVNTLSPAVRALVPVFQEKKDVIDYLVEKEKEGLSWTGVATGLLFDWGLKTGFLGYNIEVQTATIWDSGDKPFTLTNLNTIGKAVVSVLLNAGDTANKYIHIGSVTTTQNEILAALQKTTAKTWDVTHTTTEAQIKAGKDLIASGDMAGNFALVLASTYGEMEGLRADYAKDEVLANELLGPEEESVEVTVAAVVGV